LPPLSPLTSCHIYWNSPVSRPTFVHECSVWKFMTSYLRTTWVTEWGRKEKKRKKKRKEKKKKPVAACRSSWKKYAWSGNRVGSRFCIRCWALRAQKQRTQDRPCSFAAVILCMLIVVSSVCHRGLSSAAVSALYFGVLSFLSWIFTYGSLCRCEAGLNSYSSCNKSIWFSRENSGLIKTVTFETYLLPCHVDWYKVSDVSEDYAASIFRV
jgi:hypothetical protein